VIRRVMSLLLWLFPADFRSTFGADLMATFDDRWREAGSRWLAVGIIANVIANAILLRLAKLRQRGSPTRGDSRGQEGSIQAFQRDLRFACRLLCRKPGFTLVVVTVLAIGIGANSAIFSLVDAALLRPLPFAQPEKLVSLWEAPPGYTHNRVAPLNFLDWSQQNHTFAAMAAVSGASRTLIGSGSAERIPGQSVTPSLFKLLGIVPIAGRTFTADDGRRDNHVVVISERLWRSRFGSDPKLVGKAIRFDGELFTVIGIVPAEFQIFYETDVWTPFTPGLTPDQRQEHYLQVLGRLKPDVSLGEANTDLALIARNIARISPQTNKGWGVTIEPLRDSLVERELRVTSLVLAAIVGFVLLLACANVANLLLAKGITRSREIAVRASLGGSKGCILRQLFAENVLLGVLGGSAGLLLAWVVLHASPSFLPAGLLPVSLHLKMDARVIGFAAALMIATVLLFGLAPAFHTVSISPADALRAGGRTATAGMGRLRTILAIGEVAVAGLLVAGAGLLVRTLISLDRVDPGFHAPKVLTMYVALPLTRYPNPSDTLRFYQAAERELASLPGVREVALGGNLPTDGWDIGQSFEIVGEPPHEEANQPTAHYQMVGARYFETLGIPIVRGREFNNHDTASSKPVCIVNEEFVRRHLNGRNVLGTLVSVSAMTPGGPKPVVREIVGVSHQVKVEGLAERQNSLEIYVPTTQNSWYGASIVVRTEGDPVGLTSAVKAAISRIDREQPVTRIRTMNEVASESIAQPRFRARLVAAFAGLALILACVGVFGVLAFSVGQRTREFGVRMALGASAEDILRLVMSSGAKMIAAGLTIGLIAALVLTRSLQFLLFDVKPFDPATFGFSAVLLAVVGLASCAIPALRASRVEPVVALHEE
jgi:putative ABC transport system permease protein